MTNAEKYMRRLFEKSPKLKGTTFCGRTLISKLDSQIIVKLTLVSTEKTKKLNAISCVIMNRYGLLDRHLFCFSDMVDEYRNHEMSSSEDGDDEHGINDEYIPSTITVEDDEMITTTILGYVSKFFNPVFPEKTICCVGINDDDFGKE